MANRRMLQSNSAYVVDLGKEVYVWVGKQADVGQHKVRAHVPHCTRCLTRRLQLALQKAIEYLRKYNRPFTMPIHRVIEGASAALAAHRMLTLCRSRERGLQDHLLSALCARGISVASRMCPIRSYARFQKNL